MDQSEGLSTLGRKKKHAFSLTWHDNHFLIVGTPGKHCLGTSVLGLRENP